MSPPGARQRFALWMNRRVFYGWVMLVLGGVALFASGPGQSYTFSVFVTPLSESLALSRTAVSSAYGAATLLASLALTSLGSVLDRVGARTVMSGAALLLGLAALGFSQVNGLYSLFAGFVAMRLLGQGALTLAPQHLVAQWFSRLRGRAISFSVLGASASTAAFPPLAQILIDRMGWRLAMAALGVLVWALVLPAAWLLGQDRPERLGLRPDGAQATRNEGTPGTAGGTGHATAGSEPAIDYGLRRALRTRVFWIMALSGGLASMLSTGLIFHQFSILERQGVAAPVSAAVFPVFAAAMVGGALLAGLLVDRLPARWVQCLGMLALSTAMFTLNAAHTPASALLYGAVLGTASGIVQTTGVYVWPTFFGRRFMGSIQGAAKTIGHAGAALGPVPFGIAYDLLGGYREAIMALSLLPLGFAVLVLFAHPPPPARDPAQPGG